MSRHRHTRRTDPALAGPSVQKSVRIPESLFDAVSEDITLGIPEVHTFIDAVTDALWLWHYENARDRRTQAVMHPEPVAEEPVEQADEVVASNGTHGRPSWSDVDLASLEDEPAPVD